MNCAWKKDLIIASSENDLQAVSATVGGEENYVINLWNQQLITSVSSAHSLSLYLPFYIGDFVHEILMFSWRHSFVGSVTVFAEKYLV